MNPKPSPKATPAMTEQERYFAAKNARRKWWSDESYKLLLYPIMVLFFAIIACIIISLITLVGIGLNREQVKKELGIDPSSIAQKGDLFELQGELSETVRLAQGNAQTVSKLADQCLQNQSEIATLNQTVARLDAQLNPPPPAMTNAWSYWILTNSCTITNMTIQNFKRTN